MKRMKDKAFARGVKREDLRAGAELLGLPLEEHITNVIGFMREQRRRARPARHAVTAGPCSPDCRSDRISH